MEKFDLVIFDCDGVLLDSEIISCQADAEAYTRLGLQITTEEIAKRFAGMPDEAVDAELATELGRPLPANFRAKIKLAVLAKYRTEMKAIDGASSLLSSLKTAKCIASSASPAKLALGLIEADLYELVYPHIFSTRLVERGKPHPDIFLFSAEQMNVSPSRCIVIEDSMAGVSAAKRAGMACVGFTGGSHCTDDHAERLRTAGADSVIGELGAIRALVDWNRSV